MKRHFCLLLLLPVLFACEKEEQRGEKDLLVEIKSANRTSQTFEYEGKRLSKVNFYSICTVPADVVTYFYQNNRLERVQILMRSMYSSSTAVCGSAAGIYTEEIFVYDGAGRLARTNRGNNYTDYIYTLDGRVISETIFQSNGTPISTTNYKYDTRGNLIEESGPNVHMTYEYDNKVNPMHLMKQKPSYISAFTTSPNNVIKGTSLSGSSWYRTILEYQNDMPLRVSENGVEYLYVYQ